MCADRCRREPDPGLSGGPKSILKMKYDCLGICALMAGLGRSSAYGTASSDLVHLNSNHRPANGIYYFRFKGGVALAAIQGLDQ